VYKYNIAYTVPTSNAQAIGVVSPNGGESWQYNTAHNILWTSNLVSDVKIEHQTAPGGAWQTIVASTPAAGGSYSWAVPNTPTSQARVRISDVSDGSPLDSSNGFFSITVAGISVSPAVLAFGQVVAGTTISDTVRITNTGTATLVVSSVTTGTAYFYPGRTSFTISPLSSDTLSVTFAPSAVQAYSDTLYLSTNAPSNPFTVPVTGSGSPPTSVPPGGVPSVFSLAQNFPNPFNPVTTISYALPVESFVSLKVFNTLGQEVATLVHESQIAGRYSVQFPVAGANIGKGSEKLSSGIYFYRLHAGEFVGMRKMLLVK
jgi:hypothetical protein